MWRYAVLSVIPLLLLVFVGADNVICVGQKRIVESILLKHGPTSRTRWVPTEVCCSGYQNVSGTCVPICKPECVLGKCKAPNTCKCDDGWSGKLCNEPLSNCGEGYWGERCDTECDCNGSHCTENGKCKCLPGYKGEKCETPCPNGTFGIDCSETCDCLNGDCDRITGNCGCHLGYFGANCSKPCPDGKYGANCSEVCACQNNSTCNATNGLCTCPSGFQGEFCEENCSLGTWGEHCANTCNCGNDPCDSRTGSCFCKPGFTGLQCRNSCEEGSCGNQCAKTCNCLKGRCSNTDCSCVCEEGWIGENCGQEICDFMKYGPGCTENCACNATNTERCDPISGSCVCKSSWKGDTCSEGCPFGSYGLNCSKTCSCNRQNTDSCLDGACMCKPGWSGEKCEKPCEPGYYGVNCTSMCWYFGLVNYDCDSIQGDICSTNYEGKECEVCRCEPSSTCNATTGACECKAGYFGDKCLPCPRNKFGKNCKQECECEDCRKTDGYCKCQEGWKGTECSDYCPVKFYDKVNGECISQSGGVFIPWNKLMYVGVGATTMLIAIISMMVCYKCRKPRHDGMVNMNAPKITLPPAASNEYEREEHIYETVPEVSRPPSYSRLFRPDEVSDRFRNPTYFNGYEPPNDIENIRTYNITPDYVRLDRNSIGPGNLRPTYYTFKEVQV